VQHALGVGRRDAGAQLAGDVDDLLGREPADPPEERREILASHQLHREKHFARELPDVEYPAHGRVRDLPGEPQQRVGPGKVGAQEAGELVGVDLLGSEGGVALHGGVGAGDGDDGGGHPAGDALELRLEVGDVKVVGDAEAAGLRLLRLGELARGVVGAGRRRGTQRRQAQHQVTGHHADESQQRNGTAACMPHSHTSHFSPRGPQAQYVHDPCCGYSTQPGPHKRHTLPSATLIPDVRPLAITPAPAGRKYATRCHGWPFNRYG